MMRIPFNVNDADGRRVFFSRHFPDILGTLNDKCTARWGKMSAQQMAEHLLATFEISTGKLTVQCNVPEKLQERVKRFLFSDSHTPQNFKNPLLGEHAPPLRFASLGQVVERLEEESRAFIEHFRENPRSTHVHPLFGSLGAEGWERAQYKHCYHHLLQFGLIEHSDAHAENSVA